MPQPTYRVDQHNGRWTVVDNLNRARATYTDENTARRAADILNRAARHA